MRWLVMVAMIMTIFMMIFMTLLVVGQEDPFRFRFDNPFVETQTPPQTPPQSVREGIHGQEVVSPDYAVEMYRLGWDIGFRRGVTGVAYREWVPEPRTVYFDMGYDDGLAHALEWHR